LSTSIPSPPAFTIRGGEGAEEIFFLKELVLQLKNTSTSTIKES